MLKKAGFVVAAATAGLLAVSPLAFAADKSDSGHYSKSDSGHRSDHGSSDTLVNVDHDSADCDFQNTTAAPSSQEGRSTAFSLLGAAASTLAQTGTNTVTPVQPIAPAASCNNIELPTEPA